MLALALAGKFRPPELVGIRGLWFAASLLCIELPWLFAGVQFIGSLAILVLNPALGAIEGFGLVIAGASSWLWFDLHRLSFMAREPLKEAIRGLAGDANPIERERLAADYEQSVRKLLATKAWLRPFRFSRPGVERIVDVAYGTEAGQTLDLYRSAGYQDSSPMPVLLYVHGGGWVVGSKHQQGQPLLWHLAQRGWLCADINYRLAPRHKFPECLVDVKAAIAWLKRSAFEYGADPKFIAISGGSAGGHLCALAALTANDKAYQPGFETLDTQVQAAVPLYGVYDITNSLNTRPGADIVELMRRFVMPNRQEQDPETWRNASPKFRVNESAPPMFVLHGTHDDLVPVGDARDFASCMAAESDAAFAYAELPGGQHGFDLFHGVRAECSVVAIEHFLRWCLSTPQRTDKPVGSSSR